MSNPTDIKQWGAMLRALTYGILQTPEPMSYVDQAIVAAVDGRALGRSPEEYLAAIRTGLASNEDLARLTNQRKPDAVIRAYLSAIERRLAKRIEGR